MQRNLLIPIDGFLHRRTTLVKQLFCKPNYLPRLITQRHLDQNTDTLWLFLSMLKDDSECSATRA